MPVSSRCSPHCQVHTLFATQRYENAGSTYLEAVQQALAEVGIADVLRDQQADQGDDADTDGKLGCVSRNSRISFPTHVQLHAVTEPFARDRSFFGTASQGWIAQAQNAVQCLEVSVRESKS